MKFAYTVITLALCVAAFSAGINKDKADIRGYYERLYQQETKLKDKAIEKEAAQIATLATEQLKKQWDTYSKAHADTVAYYEKLRRQNKSCIDALHAEAAAENKKLLERYK